jgi:hypothetical protein
MTFWRVAAWLVALSFLLTATAVGADKFTYSGVPGKWKRQSKDSKNQGPQSEPKAQEAEKPPQKKERTVTVTIPEEVVRPGKAPKQP